MVALFAALSVFGCSVSRGNNAPLGSITAAETRVGSFDDPLVQCTSGARYYFLGADVFSPNARVRLRLVISPLDGGGMLVTSLDEPGVALRLTPENCSTLDITMQPSNWSANGIRGVHGSARFECTPVSGGTIRGEVAFSNCF